MKVIKPAALSDAQVVSSTVPETEFSAYSAGTDYTVGARAIYAHVVYESVQTPNVGHTPDAAPLYWAPVGPSNRWAMFDAEVNTQTAAAGSITVVIKPGLCNSLALFGLVGTQLQITVRDGLAGPVVYSTSMGLDGTVIADWYQYFFEPAVQRASVVLTDLPPYGNAYITVSVTGGGTVKCGHVSVGTVYDLGETQMGVSFGITDYSRKDTSATGVTTFVRRKFTRRCSASLVLPNAQINKVTQTLEDLRANPCVWIGTDVAGYDPLTFFGFYSDFSITVQYATESLCNLEIQGLV